LSDLYDPGASPLKVVHRHLTETDPLYRVSLPIAAIALAVAVIAGAGCLVWPSAEDPAQAPPAVPAAPSPPAAQAPPAAPAAPSSPAAPAQPQPPAGAAPSVAQLEALRDRAVSDFPALIALRQQADAGNPAAEFYMATLYDPTLTQFPFANKDIATSLDWYRKSAEHGFAMAQQTMGQSYQIAWGVAKNDATAAQWYMKAAQQGAPLAQYALGLMTALGQGVPKDCKVAKNWLVAAKNLGYQDAASSLASGVGGACQW
jgi:TPR repeat protein